MSRFNYRKAKWVKFTSDLDAKIAKNPPKDYKEFQKLVWQTAVQHIPRGCRTSYVPCLDDQSKQLYREYTEAYNHDPLAEDTIQLGEDLLAAISQGRLDRWIDLICNTDMTRNSKKAWTTIKKINTEKNGQTRVAAVTPNQVANQLLRNGKPAHKVRGHLKAMKRETARIMQECKSEFESFTHEDLQEAMSTLKPGKAAGLDNISTETHTIF